MTKIINVRVLLSAGVIVAMAAAAIGATYAAWTASDDIAGNTLSTANVSLTAVGLAGSGGVANPLPFGETNVLPGDVSSPVERAVVTNDGSVALDLKMYVDNVTGPACEATKIAWQSRSIVSGGPNVNLLGYTTDPVIVGSYGGPSGDTNFTRLADITGVGQAVLVASAADFEAGEKIAMRQLAGFANDAVQAQHSGGCSWTLYFIGEAN